MSFEKHALNQWKIGKILQRVFFVDGKSYKGNHFFHLDFSLNIGSANNCLQIDWSQQQQRVFWEKSTLLHHGIVLEEGLVFDEPVDVVLRPVLRRWDLEDEGNTEKGLSSITICYHLKWKIFR